MPSFAQSERARLCDSALVAGGDAPTLCGDWTVKDLLVHLVVREGDLLGAPGIAIAPLAFLTERASRRWSQHSLEQLVERVRRPPLWSPARLGALDRAMNTLEFFVHHEDIRRATPGWEPRALTGAEQGALWKAIALTGRALVRSAGIPVTIRWEGREDTHILRKGEHAVTLTAQPGELVLFLFGRDQHRGLEFDGPDSDVRTLQQADLGM